MQNQPPRFSHGQTVCIKTMIHYIGHIQKCDTLDQLYCTFMASKKLYMTLYKKKIFQSVSTDTQFSSILEYLHHLNQEPKNEFEIFRLMRAVLSFILKYNFLRLHIKSSKIIHGVKYFNPISMKMIQAYKLFRI